MGQKTSPPSAASRNGALAHAITGPSERSYKIRLLGLPAFLEFGDLPENLLDVALADVTDTLVVDVPGTEGARMTVPGSIRYVSKAEERADRLARTVELAQYQRRLVAAALIEPEMTYEELTEAIKAGSFPHEDLLLIAEIQQRLTDRDARGVKIGVESLDRWVPFPHEHEGIACSSGEDCPGVQAFRQRFSTADLGAL